MLMKPIKLEMRAFGPYRDTTVIDFTRFNEASLFLLTGTTGSGKTMIFDALTFALYGVSSGNGRPNTSLRSQYAKDDVEAVVSFVFSHNGKQYTVTRSPKQSFVKKGGRVMREHGPDAHLVLNQETLASGATRVTQQIESILGLDADQFKQIALIGQGEFRELLKASSATRKEIFRKIFNTRFYQKFEEKLEAINKEAKVNFEFELKKIEDMMKNMDDIDFEDVSVHDLDRNIEQVEQNIKSSYLEIDDIVLNRSKANASYVEVTQTLEKDKALIEKFQLLEANKVKLEKELEQESYYKKLQEHLELLENLLSEVHPKEKALKISLEKLEANQSKNKNLLVELKKGQQHLENFKKESESLLKVSDVFENNKQKIQRIQTQLKDYEILDTLQLRKETLLGQIGSSKLDQELLRKQIEENVEVLSKARLNLKVKAQLEVETKDLEQRLQSILDFQKIKIIHDELNQKIEESKNELGKSLQQLKVKRDIYNDKEHLFYLAQAGILAKSLIEGEACPVCGSFEHPHKAVLSESDLTKEMIDILKAEVEVADEKRSQLQSHFSNLKGQLDTIQSQFNNKKTQYETLDINFEIQKMEAELMQKKQSLEGLVNLDELIQNSESLETTLQNKLSINDKVYRDLEKDFIQVETAWKEKSSHLSFTSYDEAKIELDKLKKQVGEYELKRDTLAHSILNQEKSVSKILGSLQQLDIEKNNLDEEVLSSQKEYREALNKYQFTDEAKYHEILSSSGQKDDDKKHLSNYHTRLSNLKFVIQGASLELNDQIKPELSANLTLQTSLKEQMDNLNHRYGALLANVKAKEISLIKLKDLQASYLDKKKHYENVNDLFRTATGKVLGKDNISFETFVQTAYFKEVIKHANKRLDIMTQSQYSLILREDATDLKSQSGLDLDVMDHHTNSRREVSTLSGGESFKAALALALGMSDVIQSFAGGIEIDMLFVDEGFGSLDQESLDQAMKVLNDLSQYSTMVGIISHVSELKQRIEQQIVVTKGVEGSSIQIIT